jgi:multisubunit Na+/H+ antiporter MnhB subunit
MEAGYVIERPNRAKASSKTTRAIVVLLLLLSAALMLIVILGGWSALQSGQVLQLAIVVIYLLMAYYVSRWNRGPLPVAAAIAIIMGILAAVAAPGWFDRDKTGFATPHSVFGGTGLESATLGVVTVLVIPVQLLLIGFSLQAFRQDWHVEVERPVGVQSAGAGAAGGRRAVARDRRARA